MKGLSRNLSMLEALGIIDSWRLARARIFFIFGQKDLERRWIFLTSAKEISPGIGLVGFRFASGHQSRIILSNSGSISLRDSNSGSAPIIFGKRWDSFIAVKRVDGSQLFFCCPRLRNISVTKT